VGRVVAYCSAWVQVAAVATAAAVSFNQKASVESLEDATFNPRRRGMIKRLLLVVPGVRPAVEAA
jgi:hypothetical protein